MLKNIQNMWGKWRREEHGTTAVEFSLLSIPFFMLSLAIIELALMYASASLLEGATASAARQIRTGQVQAAGDPSIAFRQTLCGYTTVLISCDDVTIDVRTMDSYDDFTTAEFDENGDLVVTGFDAGGSNDRVLVRTATNYSFMTPFIGQLLSGSDGTILFMSTIVLQTEPYEFEEDA